MVTRTRSRNKKTIRHRGGRRGQLDFERMKGLVNFLSSWPKTKQFLFGKKRTHYSKVRDPCEEMEYATGDERQRLEEECHGYGHGAKIHKKKKKTKKKPKKHKKSKNKKSKDGKSKTR